MTAYICDNCGASVGDGHVVHDPTLDEQEADTFYCGPCYRAAVRDGLPEGATVTLKSEEESLADVLARRGQL